MAQGKERLWIYHQTLLGGLKADARKPTNLARVGDVQQGPTESPAAFLERLMEAFRQYTPVDPEAEGTRASLIMHFVNQAAPDIRKKLQKLECLGEKSIQDLITVAERVYNTQETPEEKQAKAADRQTVTWHASCWLQQFLTQERGSASCTAWRLKVKAIPVRDQH